jgi:hypothetical protein
MTQHCSTATAGPLRSFVCVTSAAPHQSRSVEQVSSRRNKHATDSVAPDGHGHQACELLRTCNIAVSAQGAHCASDLVRMTPALATEHEMSQICTGARRQWDCHINAHLEVTTGAARTPWPTVFEDRSS